MSALTILAPPSRDADSLARLAVLSLESPSSRRNYSREIRRFLASGRTLDREGVQAYLNGLRERGSSAISRNVALAAIRLLAREAHVRGELSDAQMNAIDRVKGAKLMGDRAGNWLNIGQVRRLLEQAAVTEYGARNQALVACMVGCGLRRAEVAGLDWDQWRQREARWCWIDVKGKGGRVRTVPCPRWAADLIERWKEEQT